MTTGRRAHWPEYLMEAAELGLFMLAACVATTLLFHPDSPARALVPDPLARRGLAGIAMGLTAVAIVYSPLGKRSGAHFNPAVTLAFLRLGRIAPLDAAGYVVAHFAGAVAGVTAAALLLGDRLAHAAVDYAVTVPGPAGPFAALVGEAAISFGMMATVLAATATPRLAPWTGCLAGALVALYIGIEAPLSGMSMNPARTLGSALPAGEYTALWVYFTAPLAGMLLAAEGWVRIRGRRGVGCAKLRHRNGTRCIFCAYQERRHG
jgi:aquaporin Z